MRVSEDEREKRSRSGAERTEQKRRKVTMLHFKTDGGG
jgi:hypothetical protein